MNNHTHGHELREQKYKRCVGVCEYEKEVCLSSLTFTLFKGLILSFPNGVSRATPLTTDM